MIGSVFLSAIKNNCVIYSIAAIMDISCLFAVRARSMVKEKLKFKTIRQKFVLRAPVEAVYDAWTDPKVQAEFTGSPATGKAIPGGFFTAWDGYIMGKYKLLEKNKKIIAEWKTTEWPDGYPPSQLTLSFKEKSAGTESILIHERVPAEQASEYALGWKDFFWEPLDTIKEMIKLAQILFLHYNITSLSDWEVCDEKSIGHDSFIVIAWRGFRGSRSSAECDPAHR
jgi:uncharacterized protein YndB with AHSA1/START domain